MNDLITICNKNYQLLNEILPKGIEHFMTTKQNYYKLKAAGYMDLNIEKIGSNRIAMAHNGILNGDNMADPDMEILVNIEHRFITACTYQNDYVGIYQDVFEDGIINQKLKKELNYFLNTWLKNVRAQGHRLDE